MIKNDCDDTYNWYKRICNNITNVEDKVDILAYVCPEFEHDLMYEPTMNMLLKMSDSSIYKLAKDILPFDVDMKERILVVDMIYDRIYLKNLKSWLKQLSSYVNSVMDCAIARQDHFEKCIVTGIWKNGEQEEAKHKHWREQFNQLATDCQHTLLYWDSYARKLEKLIESENTNTRNFQFEKALKYEKERQKLENDRIEKMMKTQLFNPDVDERKQKSAFVSDEIIKLRKNKIKQAKEYKEYLRNLEEYKRQQRQMRKEEEDKLVDKLDSIQNERRDAYESNSRVTPAFEDEMSQINLDDWLRQLLLIFTTSPLDKKAYDKLKLKAHEFLSLSHATNKQAMKFAEIIVNSAFGENIIVIDRVMSSALLFAPYIHEDDLHKESYRDMMSGKRNEPELSAIQKNIYFAFVMSLCNTYLQKSIEFATPDPFWNRKLYTQILSLLNRPMLQTIYQQFHWNKFKVPENDKQYYDAFLSEMNCYTNYYIHFFNEAINSAYGLGTTKDWCFPVGYHLKRYTEFVMKQRTETPLEIKDVDDTKKRLIIRAFNKELTSYKNLQKFIKHYNKICMIEDTTISTKSSSNNNNNKRNKKKK